MKHYSEIQSIPTRSGKYSTPDGAVNGNGDLGIVLGNAPDGLRIYMSKCDLWYPIEQKRKGGLKPLGWIDIPVPSSLYVGYHVIQDMDAGEIRCEFSDTCEKLQITLRVCAVENTVMIESNLPVKPVLSAFAGDAEGHQGTFAYRNCSLLFRRFADTKACFATEAWAALTSVNPFTWYCPVATNHDTVNPAMWCIQNASAITAEKYEQLKEKHCRSWTSFYEDSSFCLSDPLLENNWYASQYFLKCTAGNKMFPPGLFGNFITVANPDWHSDYHLNYNYQAPFYASFSSNHIHQTDGYHIPLEEFISRGKENASHYGCGGILYPVALEPKGVYSEMMKESPYWFERLFLGQKSNALHAADIMIFRWYATRDLSYARSHAYPYLKACLDFFLDYAVWEPDRGLFSVPQDAIHEVPYYLNNFNPEDYRNQIYDKNNVLTIGLLRMGLSAAIDMSESLDADAALRNRWEFMLDHLPPFPVFLRNGKPVYRYTESGMDWNDSNDCGQQHIYPAGCIGLSSAAEELDIARETLRQKACWEDGNAVSSFYPMAVRIGLPPEEIIDHLRSMIQKNQLPNMLFLFGGGCLEYISITATTLNEMALQSHQKILHLFPCWDRRIDADFNKLRADGAFLVSSGIHSGKIRKTTIYAEIGGKLSIANPFFRCQLTVNGASSFTEQKEITLNTIQGDEIILQEAEAI